MTTVVSSIKTSALKISDTLVRLAIEVPAPMVSGQIDNAVNNIAKRAKLPGFRPGKVPASVIAAKYRREISEEVREQLVQQSFSQALRDNSVVPLITPTVGTLPNVAKGEAFSFEVDVEVKPTVTLGALESLTVKTRSTEVSESDVDDALLKLRQRQGVLKPVEGREVAALDDTVTVAIEGSENGMPIPGTKAEDAQIELESKVEAGEPFAKLRDGLVGMKVGESKTIVVEYPEDFRDDELAGRTVSYAATLKKISVLEVPAADDEFAKDQGQGLETLAQLREKLAEDLREARAKVEGRRLRNRLVRVAAKQFPFAVPTGLLRAQIDRVATASLGIPENTDLEMIASRVPGLDVNRIRASAFAPALVGVQKTLVADAYAAAHEISVSQEEVDARVEEIAAAQGQPVAKLRAAIAREGDAPIRATIREEKALDAMVKLVQSEVVSSEELDKLDAEDEKAAQEEVRALLAARLGA